MFQHFKKEESGEVVGYLLILFAILTLLWAYYPPIQNIILGSDPTEGVEEVTKPIDETPIEPTGPTTPPPPIEKPKPKTYDFTTFKITLPSSGPAKPTNGVQFKLTLQPSEVDYSKIHANGDNLRFFDEGFKEIPYWIESWNYGGVSTVWLKIPSYGTYNINMVYGDMNLRNKSNGEKTFPFFDNFDNGSAFSSNLWQNFSNATVQNGALVLNADGVEGTKDDEVISKLDFSDASTNYSVNVIVKSHTNPVQFNHGFTKYYYSFNEKEPIKKGIYQNTSHGITFKQDTRVRTFPLTYTTFATLYKGTGYDAEVYDGRFMFTLIGGEKNSIGNVKLQSFGDSKIEIDAVYVTDQNLQVLFIRNQSKVGNNTFLDELGIVN